MFKEICEDARYMMVDSEVNVKLSKNEQSRYATAPTTQRRVQSYLRVAVISF